MEWLEIKILDFDPHEGSKNVKMVWLEIKIEDFKE